MAFGLFFTFALYSTTQHDINSLSRVTITSFVSEKHKLINLTNFNYLYKQPSCSRKVKIFIVVHSFIDNTVQRARIRDTWGSYNGSQAEKIRLLFLLGSTPNEDESPSVIKESKKYHDILQGNFIESFKNATYKHVMGLKWFTENCPYADFILKVNDDTFINTPQLFSRILEPFNLDSKFIMCRENARAIIRNPDSKWHVSYQDLKDEKYPRYCSGFAILYSQNAAVELYKEAQKGWYFWIDDAYVTGYLRATIQAPIMITMDFIGNDLEDLFNAVASKKGDMNTLLRFLVAPAPQVNTSMWARLWKVVLENIQP